MEQRRASLDPEILFCSICLDQLKDPVTVPCGHSYCLSCINGFWDGEDQKKIYSCPQCRQEFTARPVLKKSTMLAALVEQLKKTGLQAAAAAGPCYAAAGDVSCDVCTGRKLKALKSCLVCLTSYCENHLQFHHESPRYKKHQLVEPSEKLQENICSQHDEVMKMFCRSDQQIICYLCSVDQHKGHDTVSAAAERSERQKELEGSRQNIQQRIQDREEDLKLLQQQLEALSRSADKAVEDSEEIFTQLIRLLQKRSCELKQQIRSQQQTEVSGLQDVEEKLQQEIRELKRKDAELKLLSHTEDHNQFLHNYPRTQLSGGTSSIQIPPLRRFEGVTAAVSELRDQLQDVLKDTWTNIYLAATGPTTRAEGQLQNVLKDTWTNIDLAATGPKTRAEGQLQNVLKHTWTNISLAATGPKTRAEGQLQNVPKHTWTNISLAATGPKTRAEGQLQDVLKDRWTNISLAATGPKTRAEGQLQDVLKHTWTNISLAATGPKTRAEGQLQDVLKDRWTNISLAATGPKTRAEGQLQDVLKHTWTNIYLAATGPKTRAEGQLQNVPKHTWTNIDLAATGPKTRAEGQLQDVLKDTWTNIDLAATGPKTRAEGQLQDVLKDTWTNIDLAATGPKTRAEFFKYSCEITMDPNTAHTFLLLSDGNRKATNTYPQLQPYSSHPDRFINSWCCQVLSRHSLTGRCYWEVEMRGGFVAVTYKNISRSGRESLFGRNNKSWVLDCSSNSYRFDFNNIQTSVSGPVSSRIGVFLDHRAGLLSFYSISETMTLLHRVQTTFTQPLYAGLYVCVGSTAEFCEVK